LLGGDACPAEVRGPAMNFGGATCGGRFRISGRAVVPESVGMTFGGEVRAGGAGGAGGVFAAGAGGAAGLVEAGVEGAAGVAGWTGAAGAFGAVAWGAGVSGAAG
jgi:hypothetical protein